MPRHPLLRLLPALVVVIAAAGCSAETLAFTIGECVNLPATAEITEFETVDCAEAHDAEVYALPQHPAGPEEGYPGQEVLTEFSIERCEAAFEPYVGTPYATSELTFTTVIPTEASWGEAGDREITCLLVGDPVEGTDPQQFQQLTGSKAGSEE
jgi:hypothetical protein